MLEKLAKRRRQSRIRRDPVAGDFHMSADGGVQIPAWSWTHPASFVHPPGRNKEPKEASWPICLGADLAHESFSKPDTSHCLVSVWSNTTPQTGNVIHNGNESLTVPQISKIKTLTDQEPGWWDFFVCHCLLIPTLLTSHFWKYCQAQGLCPRM